MYKVVRHFGLLTTKRFSLLYIVLNYSNALHLIDSRDTAAFIIIDIKYVDSEIDSPKPL